MGGVGRLDTAAPPDDGCDHSNEPGHDLGPNDRRSRSPVCQPCLSGAERDLGDAGHQHEKRLVEGPARTGALVVGRCGEGRLAWTTR